MKTGGNQCGEDASDRASGHHSIWSSSIQPHWVSALDESASMAPPPQLARALRSRTVINQIDHQALQRFGRYIAHYLECPLLMFVYQATG